MATTANYGWTKPAVGGDLDAWGAEINTDLDSIDTVVHGIDTRAIPAASSTAPAMDGAAAVGTGTTFARADHVHPTDTSRAAVTALPAPSSSTPLMNGTAAAGTGAAYARGDHVHPVDVSRYDASNPSGFITAAGAPVQSVSTRTGAIVLTHTDITDWTSALSGYALVGSQPSPSSANPLMNGTASPGSSAAYSRGDHVHPPDTSKYSTTNPSNYQTGAQVTAQLAGYLPTAGGRVTGMLTVGSVPATDSVLRIDRPSSGVWSALYYSNNGSDRWSIFTTSGAETGSANGCDLQFVSLANNSNYFATPINIQRSNSATTFSVPIVNGPSDATLKGNVALLEGALDKVLALRGVSFNMLATPEKREIGLIAQEVQPIVPEIIQSFPTYNSLGQKEDTTKLALDYPKLTALLIEAVKTLTLRVEALEGING